MVLNMDAKQWKISIDRGCFSESLMQSQIVGWCVLPIFFPTLVDFYDLHGVMHINGLA